MDEKTVCKIDARFGPKFAGAYTFRQVSQGEYEQVLVSYMDALGKIPHKDVLKVNREMLWLAMVEQPEAKPLNHDYVVHGQMPMGLSIKLQEAYDKANGISPEEQRFLSSPLDDEKVIPDSPSLLSATASDGQSPNTMPQAEKQSQNSA